MKRDIIEINREIIPYEFDIVLADETFKIGVNYNNTAELFTLDLSKLDEESGEYETICKGEPVIYGKPLWEDVYINGKYPALVIIPIDESGEYNKVTYDNLNKTVFLCIDNTEDDIKVQTKKQNVVIVNSNTEDGDLVYCKEYYEEIEEMIDDSKILEK